VIQRCEIFTSDAGNDKPAALGFAPKPGRAHAAAWECDFRRLAESERRIVTNVFFRHSLKSSRRRD
jgi:hypothetical protein